MYDPVHVESPTLDTGYSILLTNMSHLATILQDIDVWRYRELFAVGHREARLRSRTQESSPEVKV